MLELAVTGEVPPFEVQQGTVDPMPLLNLKETYSLEFEAFVVATFAVALIVVLFEAVIFVNAAVAEGFLVLVPVQDVFLLTIEDGFGLEFAYCQAPAS